LNRLYDIGGVMISVLASSAVDRRFEPRSGQTKDYEIGIFERWIIIDKLLLHYKKSEWLLSNVNSAIFQLYHGENKLVLDLLAWAENISIFSGVVANDKIY
jgi:hypothetical protein